MSKKDEMAVKLIEWHFQIEPETTEIHRFISADEEDPREPIKLLEVNQTTMETGQIDPFPFGPAADIPFTSVIAQITPEEMRQVRDNIIPLPKGWNLEQSQFFTPPKRMSQKMTNGSS